MADFDISSSFIPALHKPASLLPITKHHDVILYLVETYPFTIVNYPDSPVLGKSRMVLRWQGSLHHAGTFSVWKNIKAI
jgi:hypothetical protein